MTAIERENILPPRTHNNPPDPIEILRTGLTEKHGALRERSAALAGMADRLPEACEDEETAARLTDAIKSCTAFVKTADTTRVGEKEPHLAAGRAVDGFFKGLSDPVEKVKAAMSRLLTVYDRKKADEERRRREAEAEAARKEAAEREAAARTEADLDRAIRAEQDAQKAREAAAAKPAEMSRERTDLGAVRSLRTTWVFEIEDTKAVPREFLSINEGAIRVAIKAATDKEGRCTLQIPGVRIFARAETIVR